MILSSIIGLSLEVILPQMIVQFQVRISSGDRHGFGVHDAWKIEIGFRSFLHLPFGFFDFEVPS